MKIEHIALIGVVGIGGVIAYSTFLPTEDKPLGGALTQFIRVPERLTEIIQTGTTTVKESVETVTQITYLPERIGEGLSTIIDKAKDIIPELPDFTIPKLPTIPTDGERSILFPLLNPLAWLSEIGTGVWNVFSAIPKGVYEAGGSMGGISLRISEGITGFITQPATPIVETIQAQFTTPSPTITRKIKQAVQGYYPQYMTPIQQPFTKQAIQETIFGKQTYTW